MSAIELRDIQIFGDALVRRLCRDLGQPPSDVRCLGIAPVIGDRGFVAIVGRNRRRVATRAAAGTAAIIRGIRLRRRCTPPRCRRIRNIARRIALGNRIGGFACLSRIGELARRASRSRCGRGSGWRRVASGIRKFVSGRGLAGWSGRPLGSRTRTSLARKGELLCGRRLCIARSRSVGPGSRRRRTHRSLRLRIWSNRKLWIGMHRARIHRKRRRWWHVPLSHARHRTGTRKRRGHQYRAKR